MTPDVTSYSKEFEYAIAERDRLLNQELDVRASFKPETTLEQLAQINVLNETRQQLTLAHIDMALWAIATELRNRG